MALTQSDPTLLATPLPVLVQFQTCVSPIPAMPTSKLLIVIVTRSVRPVVSQKEIHKPLVSAERNRPGVQALVEMKERLIKSRSEPDQLPGVPRWAGLAVSDQPFGDGQGKARIS